MRGATVSTACRSSTDVTRGVNLWGVMNSRRSIYWLRGYGALARTDYKEVPPRGLRADPARSQLGRRDRPAVHLGNREHGGNGKHLRQARHFALAGC